MLSSCLSLFTISTNLVIPYLLPYPQQSPVACQGICGFLTLTFNLCPTKLSASESTPHMCDLCTASKLENPLLPEHMSEPPSSPLLAIFRESIIPHLYYWTPPILHVLSTSPQNFSEHASSCAPASCEFLQAQGLY